MEMGIKVALAGNPNSGKTTLFNVLTGMNQSTGNWPGVTVEKKTGRMVHNRKAYQIIDLPGTYTLNPFTMEEKITRDFIIREKPDVVVNVVDITNPARNMNLTLELIETGTPTLLAFNMLDVFEKRKGTIDTEEISRRLGIPCVAISATKGKGIHHLSNHIAQESLTGRKVVAGVPWFPANLMHLMDPGQDFFHNVKSMEQKDHYKEIITARQQYINETLSKSFKVEGQHGLTEKIDRILTNRWTGLPVFALMMFLVFQVTFGIGNFFSDLLEGIFTRFSGWSMEVLASLGAREWLASLVGEGIISGVGGVLVFLPNIVILFTAIALLEDSGYIARAAFVMDGIMKKAGLNGKAFVPMVMGFGCNVPAIMATRTLQSNKEKLLAILINPFMSCGARLPIYILFAGLFFRGSENIVTFSLYILGILVAVFMGTLLKRTVVKAEDSFFIMELPDYRLPNLKSVFLSVWERAKDYVVKAGTIIFSASVVMWLLLNFNSTGMVEITESFAAIFGRFLSVIFKPLGFGTWQSSMAIIGGIMAKEAVVSNFSIIYGFAESGYELMRQSFTAISAYSFLVFSLLYTPCVAVIGVIRRETGSSGWTLFSVGYQFLTAWVFAFLFFSLGSLLGLFGSYLVVAALVLAGILLMNKTGWKKQRVPKTIE
ncbi:MAG: ferrous iron transport protein B [Clostridia bacterium]